MEVIIVILLLFFATILEMVNNHIGGPFSGKGFQPKKSDQEIPKPKNMRTGLEKPPKKG